MLSKNTEVETIKLIKCTNVENTTQYKINMIKYIIIKTACQYVMVPNNLLCEPKDFKRSNNRICETLNREVKENTSFLSNASKFGILLSTNILLALL